MSQSGAVYQPTTVTYEANTSPQERWSDRPISYLAATVSRARHPCGLPCLPPRNYIPPILFVFSLVFVAVGLIMLVNGSIDYSDTRHHIEESQKLQPAPDASRDLIIAITGAVFFVIGVLFLGLYMRLSRKVCCRTGKDHLNTTGGQALTVNPSTDLLVAAQYAPVSEVAYQPPPEDSEQSKLMPQENKDISNEDTDRMVESDPRIVLRPLNPPAHEET